MKVRESRACRIIYYLDLNSNLIELHVVDLLAIYQLQQRVFFPLTLPRLVPDLTAYMSTTVDVL